MEHTPPPFFKRGPAPLARLAFFASLSLALLVADAHFRFAEGLRNLLMLAAYPLQQVALAPIVLGERVGRYFVSQAALRDENDALRANLMLAMREAQRYEAAEADAARLKALAGAAPRIERRATLAEIIYTRRDPFVNKVMIGRGTTQGIRAGSPVVDNAGVIGQVTRVYPFVSEVTLATDKDQAIPVEVVRNGLRAIAFGGGSSGLLELRYMAASVDIRDDDQLVTSGIDGTYPAGIPVGTVIGIERDAAHGFARILCKPAGGPDRGRFVMVLASEARLPPYPSRAEEGRRRAAPKAQHERKRESGGSAR